MRATLSAQLRSFEVSAVVAQTYVRNRFAMRARGYYGQPALDRETGFGTYALLRCGTCGDVGTNDDGENGGASDHLAALGLPVEIFEGLSPVGNCGLRLPECAPCYAARVGSVRP